MPAGSPAGLMVTFPFTGVAPDGGFTWIHGAFGADSNTSTGVEFDDNTWKLCGAGSAPPLV